MFNRKAKRIRELENDLKESKDGREQLNAKVKALEKQLAGERICGRHCAFCENHYAEVRSFRGSLLSVPQEYEIFCCKLDIKCRDFKEKGPVADIVYEGDSQALYNFQDKMIPMLNGKPLPKKIRIIEVADNG